ncbi:hypothetical protein WA1_21465 [Scytonema hofmannii PCC 7110]|uniref:Uncharacterized protein n=1 Tax=Scytonema hofmannii PCC 7110 TaxID=128403 RepID=A0A139XCV4_9CYAN|nr:hypothetical protein [Scytonema hofmannii]KYC42531.1 hypothetical protein WA1_21465 [Scytonema hofmannii PCC 7110]
MSLRKEPLDWQLNASEIYLPFHYKGSLVGFLKQEFADEVLKVLNEDEVLKKALKIACAELIKQSGGELSQVKDLMKKYIKISERPKHGTRAIAILLGERQQELDLNNQEFAKFCDTFKLSPVELNNIYAGEPLDDSLLAPLSRILGISKTELCEIRDGCEREIVSG